MIHELKIKSEYFRKVAELKKRFEVRKNDRDFHVGDFLALNEVEDENGEYTGDSVLVIVTYILDSDDYTKEDIVIMSIEPCEVRVNIQRNAMTGAKEKMQILNKKMTERMEEP